MIKCDITSQIVELSPGANTTVSLTVTNQSQVIDEFTVSIQPAPTPETIGLNQAWITLSPTQFSLRPTQQGRSPVAGENQQTVKIVITIPAQVEANNYAGVININARTGSTNSAQLSFNLIISEREEQKLEIQPQEQSSRRRTEIYRLTLTNQGNSPHLYSAYGEDDEDKCLFDVVPTEVTLQPGEQAAFTLKVRPRQRNLIDSDRRYPFKVRLEGFSQEVSGAFVQQCALPPLRWLQQHWFRIAFAIGILLVLLIAATLFLFPVLFPTPEGLGCAAISQRAIDITSNNSITEIHVSGPGGTELKPVNFTEQSALMPGVFSSLVSVSPDGRRLAYVTAQNLSMDNAHIIIVDLMNMDINKNPVRIKDIPVPSGLWPTAPVWSSAGDKIAFVKRPISGTVGSATGTTAPSDTPALTASPGISGTTTPTATATPTATTITPGTPGANVAVGGQLELWVIDLTKEVPQKATAMPSRLKADLFYGTGNRDRTSPVLCWAADDQGILIRPRLDDKSATGQQTQTLVPLDTSSKSREVSLTPMTPLWPVTPKTIFAQPNAMIMPINMMVPPVAQAQSGTPGTTRSPTATQNTNCTVTRFFSQNDPRWANMTLSPSNASKLGEWGCPITGAAILLNYQGVETTPAALNGCLAGFGLTVPLKEDGWAAVGQQCGSFKLLNGVRGDFSWDKLDSALQNGPSIVGLLGGPSGLHFVVVTSGENGDASKYDVVDPWDGSSGKTLADFISWGYRPRWLISYDAGIGTACNGPGVNAQAGNGNEGAAVNPEKSGTGKSEPATPIDITTDGVDDGGMYQDPVNFHYSISGVPTATATIFFTPKNGGPDQVLLNPLPGDVQQLRDEGNYAIDIVVRGANNQIVAGKFLYFTIDRTPPDITPLVNSTNALQQTATTNNKTVRLQFNTKDSLSGIALVQYQINGGTWETYNSDTVSVPPTFDNPGAYVVRYFAQDGAGNQSQSSFINFNIIGANGVLTPTNPTLPPVVAPGGATTPSPSNGNGGGGTRTLPPVQAQGNGGGSVPTITPQATSTPRPPVKATVTPTATVAITTPTTPLLPGTTVVPTAGFITPFPTATPTITPTAAPTLTPVATATPTPTTAPSAKIVLSANPVIINSSGTPASLQLTNSGNAATNWTIVPGSSSGLLTFSLVEGTLNAGGASTTIQIGRVNPNLTGSDIQTTFTINSDGSSQTVTVVIQPTPTPTASFVPITLASLDISQTVQLNVSTNNSSLIADHAIITATYVTCPDSNSCQASAAPNTIGRTSGPSWSLVWNTNDVMPQNNIVLNGVLCTSTDDSQCVAITALSGLKIQMGATINLPAPNTEINSSTVISITPTGRTALVRLGYLTTQNGSQETSIGQVDSSTGWKINWNGDLITPETANVANPITLTATVCNSAASTPSCFVIDPVTGLHTDMHGSVATVPELTNGSVVSGTISITATASSTNVQHFTILATYRDSGEITATVHSIASLALDSNRQANYAWDVSKLPAQTGIILQVQGCFSFDDTICIDFGNYKNLQILPGAVTTLKWNNQIQAAQINTTYTYPLRVTATDANGNPVSGVVVTYQAPTDLANVPSGTFTTTNNTASTTYTAITDNTGTATSSLFTANGVVGYVSITATAGALSAPIALTNNSPYQYSLVINDGDNQFTPILNTFTVTLSVKITVPNVAVTFTAPADDTTASGTFANGLHSVTVTSTGNGIVSAPSLLRANTVVDSFTVQVTADNFTPIFFSLTNRKGSPANILLSNPGSPSAQILTQFVPPGGTGFQATVTDAGNNPVDPGIPITFQAPISGPSGTFTQSLATNSAASNFGTVTTDASGIAIMPPFFANYQASSTAYPVKAFWATNPAVTSSSSFNMINLVGKPFSVTMESAVPQPIQLKTLQNYSSPLTATVFDAGHNLVSNTPVTFTVIPNSGAGGTFSGGSSTASSVSVNTNGNGTAIASGVNFTANCVINQQYKISATANSGSSAGLNFTNIVGDPGQLLAAVGLPQSVKVSQTFGLVSVHLYDSCLAPNLHPLDSGYQVAFNLPPTNTQPSASFPSSSNPYSITVASSNNDGTGTYTLNSGQIMADALTGSYPITATVNGFGSSPIMTSTLTNTAGNPGSLVPSTTALTTTVNQPFVGPGTPLSVTVYDQFNNKVPGAVVIFDTPPLPVTTGATATFTTTNTYSEATTTNANGVATATQLTASQIVGTYQLTITVGSLTQVVNLTNVAGAPNKILPGNSSFSTTVKTPFSTIFGVQVLDTYNNPVPGTSVSYNVINNGPIGGSFTTDPMCNTGTTSQSLTTDTNGNVTPIALCANQKAGTYSLQVSAGTATASYALTNTPETTPATIILEPASQTTAVVNNNYTNITLTVEDQYNNPIPNVSVTLTTPSNQVSTDVTGVFPGTLSSSTASTNASGQLIVTTLRASHIAGSYTMVATAGTINLNVAMTNTADPSPGQLQLIAISPTTFSVPVFTHPSASIVVSLTDQFNNPVPGVSITFTTPGSGASGTFPPGNAHSYSINTDSNGFGTILANNYTANGTSGTYSMVAQAGSVTGPSITFTVQNTAGAANAGNTTVTPSPIQLQVGTTFPNIVISVRDNANNPVIGVTATLSASTSGGGATAVIPTAIWGTNSDASGNITITNFLQANTVSGNYVLTINLGSFSKTINVTNVAGPATTIVPSPAAYTATQLAGGGSYGTLAAKVTDQYGNPVPNVAVVFTAPSTGASGTFPGNSASAGVNTNAGGVATTGVLTANSTLGEFQVTASLGLTPTIHTATTDYDFTNNATMSITGGNNQTILVGATSGGLQVKVAGSGGTGINGIPVTFDTGGSAYGTFGGTATTTNATTAGGGVAQAAVTAGSGYLGSYNVTATITIKPGLTVQQVFTVINNATMGITAGDNATLLAGGDTDTLTIQLSGSGTTKAQGIPVTFVVSPAAAGTLSSGTANTDTSGNASVTLTSGAYIGSFTVVATVQGIPAITKTFHLLDSANITLNTGDAQTKLINGEPFSPLSVIVTGHSSTPLSSVPITFTANAGGFITFTPPSGVSSSNASGIASISAVAAGTIGTFTVTATFKDGTNTKTVTFNLADTAKLVPTTGNNLTVAAGGTYTPTLAASFEDYTNTAFNPTGTPNTTFTITNGTGTGSFKTGATISTSITFGATGTAADIGTNNSSLIGNTAGTFTVTATCTINGVNLIPASFSETVT